MTEIASAAASRAGMTPAYRTKLIEVALPLEAINTEAALRKRKAPAGYPTTLHKWWAQRPLAACRAVLFAQLVDDPSAVPEEFPTEDAQAAERERLFGIIERLVVWENSTNERVLFEARREIARSVARAAGVDEPETEEAVAAVLREHAPPVLDPFCGGGSIPLEAQRLGLEAHASDLNPVAVLITKALIEIPPKFKDQPPVNPQDRAKIGSGSGWKGAAGLAADVRYYGKWMRDEAFKRIGHLYPKVTLPPEQGGGEATVVAWLWARTVRCPNPACGAQMPLVRSFALSTKKGRETWVEPVVNHAAKMVCFEVHSGAGKPPDGTKARGYARCLVCSTNTKDDQLREQASEFGMGQQLMAVVAEGRGGRTYLPAESVAVVEIKRPDTPWLDQPMPANPRWFSPPGYGLPNFADLFTSRQLVALTTLSDLVGEARERARQDALIAGLLADGVALHQGGSGATACADAVATYLAFAVSRVSDYGSTLASWRPKDNAMRSTLAKQALPMVWDYAEGSPFASSSSGFAECVGVVARCLDFVPCRPRAHADQADATTARQRRSCVIATDPPYYDNVGYADLSDYLYVWLRRSLRPLWPTLFSTVLVPKAEELVATPYRFNGSRDRAETFFRTKLGKAFESVRQVMTPSYPLTVYYAFKQADEKGADGEVSSTGWETMLAGLVHAGFGVSGTWPVRTEGDNRQVGNNANALASSILLVCRAQPADAPTATRREFVAALRAELPEALARLRQGAIAPVDLPQAAIGPGMRVFSRYSRVINAEGAPMPVRAVLELVNQIRYEVEVESTAEFDAETRWALAWFEQYGTGEGKFGDAETMFKAMNTSERALREAHVADARGGKVRLIRRDELPPDWDPLAAHRVTVWGLAQALIAALDRSGEAGAASLLCRAGGLGDAAQVLAYALYPVADRKGWTEEGVAYNSLAASWPEISKLAAASESGQIGLGV